MSPWEPNIQRYIGHTIQFCVESSVLSFYHAGFWKVNTGMSTRKTGNLSKICEKARSGGSVPSAAARLRWIAGTLLTRRVKYSTMCPSKRHDGKQYPHGGCRDGAAGASPAKPCGEGVSFAALRKWGAGSRRYRGKSARPHGREIRWNRGRYPFALSPSAGSGRSFLP